MYTRVKSLAELEDKKLNGRFIAGGTDLVPLMKLGLKEPRLLIDVTKLPELHGISLSDKKYRSARRRRSRRSPKTPMS